MRRRKPIDVSLLYGRFIASIPLDQLPYLRGMVIRWPQNRTDLIRLAEANGDEMYINGDRTDRLCSHPLIATVTRVLRKSPHGWLGKRTIYYRPLFPYYDLEECEIIGPATPRKPYLYCLSEKSFLARILQVIPPAAQAEGDRDYNRFLHI